MSGRRGAGTGSIFYESAKGLYCAQIYVPEPSGGRRAVRRRAKLRKEANRLLLELQIQHLKGTHPVTADTRLTLGEHLDYWLEQVLPMRDGVRSSTQGQYRWALMKYVVPEIGSVRLRSLTRRHVESVLQGMVSRGLSASTMAKARVPLCVALDDAEERGLIRDNPARAARMPRTARRKTRDALNREDLGLMLAAARGRRIEPLVQLAFMTGLRRGELLALRWPDVDLESNVLYVSATLKSQPGGGWYLDPPKTEHGNRSIPITSQAVESLKIWRSVQEAERQEAAERWQDYGFVFTTPMGTPLDARNVLRQWQDCSEAAGLGRIRFHAARHTFATLTLQSGHVELHVLSRLLGHGSVKVTADIYSNIVPLTMRDEISQALSYMGLGQSDPTEGDEPGVRGSVTD